MDGLLDFGPIAISPMATGPPVERAIACQQRRDR